MIVVSGVRLELKLVIAPLPVNVKTPFTETLPSTIKFFVIPKPPFKTTAAVVELLAGVKFANNEVDSTFAKNFSIVIFLRR